MRSYELDMCTLVLSDTALWTPDLSWFGISFQINSPCCVPPACNLGITVEKSKLDSASTISAEMVIKVTNQILPMLDLNFSSIFKAV